MAHLEEMTKAGQEGQILLETQHRRLQVLVGELLCTNQELRFKVAQLEERAESAESGLAGASQWSGALFL